MDEYLKILRQATRYHQKGDFVQAEKLYRQVLEQKPNQSLALHSMGLIAYQQQNFEDAAEFVSQAINADPQAAHLYNSMGVISEALDQTDKAIRSYQEALHLKPDYAEAHKNLGLIYQNQQKNEQAIKCFQTALNIDTNCVECMCHLADLLLDCNRYAEAVANYKNAIMLNPNMAEAYNNLALALKQQNRFDEAVNAQQKALQLKPDQINFQTNMASIYQAKGSLTEALAICKKVIDQSPDNPVHYYNLACVLRDQGLLDEAIDNNNKALQLDSQMAAAHWNQAICYLLNGNFPKGWQEFQWRRQIPYQYRYPHYHAQPMWQGEPLQGNIYVYCEQGLGDAIQFLRYMPQVKNLCSHVTLGAWKPLIQLFKNHPDIDELVCLNWSSPPDIKFDMQCSLLDLPAVFNINPNTMEAPKAYITAEPEKIEYFKDIINAPGLKVGIAWSGSKRHVNDRTRSADFTYFETLTSIPNISIYSLQKHIRDIRLKEKIHNLGITDLAEHLTGFANTAAIIANLDLIITVDTAVLHLAGAMNKSTWGLLAFSPDWRWMLKRTDSPWYPGMRLFRPDKPGNWDSVFDQVKTHLRDTVTDFMRD